jgi:hypothetical protein
LRKKMEMWRSLLFTVWRLNPQLNRRLRDAGGSQQDIIPARKATIGDTLLCRSKLQHCHCEGTLPTLLGAGHHFKSVLTPLKTLC